MKKIDLSKLELKMYTYMDNEFICEENEDDFYEEVFTIKFVKDEAVSYIDYPISIFKSTDKQIFNICYSYNENFHLTELVKNLGSNFTENFYINYDGKNIGHACITRIFVDSWGTIDCWLDNECPNSMAIAEHIMEKDYKKVEGRYIGIIDELLINPDYYSRKLHQAVIKAIGAIFDHYKLGMYYIYTMPKDTDDCNYQSDIKSELSEKEYKKSGFKVVNKDLNIMRRDNWKNHDIMAGSGGFYEIV